MTNEELVQEYRVTGRQELLDRLVMQNMPLVWSVWRKMPTHLRPPREDVESVGALGLIRAVEKFDPEKGSYSAIAAWWVRAELEADISGAAGGMMPAHQSRVLLSVVPRKIKALVAEGCSEKEATERVCRERKVARRTLESARAVASARFDDVADVEIRDDAPAVDDSARTRGIVAEIIAQIEPKRTRDVISLRFLEDKESLKNLAL
ncbi:hypothetical protein DLJ49_20855 [Rhodovulum sp. 12E13]|uniref:sigma-70 family RNA polymerase sigma factor n=1 Tax=Rhodovulum sp. 12E13 TaxID=2203891 RepID=UPI000E139DD4|nr:sigma-70 family RNA polymerase sigma factor [Rhodovulum sp. 12E13]RDC67730.1 hypothetical protein DLJ49_20855 [Rhodovulum sp. 12E13]